MQTASIEVKVSEDGEVEFSVKCNKPTENKDAMATALAMINSYMDSEGIAPEDVTKEAKFYGEGGKLIGEG